MLYYIITFHVIRYRQTLIDSPKRLSLGTDYLEMGTKNLNQGTECLNYLETRKSFLFYGTNKLIIGTKNIFQVQIVLNEDKRIKIQINIRNLKVMNMYEQGI